MRNRRALQLAGMALATIVFTREAPADAPAPRLVATYPLTLNELSDLTIDETGSILWVVTNKPDRVYQLDVAGKVTKTLAYTGEDLEGIAYDRSDRTLWIAEENRREIVHLDLEGNVLSRHRLGLVGEKNSGLEGLCLDDKQHLFALNEKRPGLFLELAADLSIAKRVELSFAKDYSAITYSREHGCFWVVSDQSQALYLWNPKQGVLEQHALTVPKPEGVAVDEARKRLYIVSDSEPALYVYEIVAGAGNAGSR